MQFKMLREAGVTGRIAMMASMIDTARRMQMHALRLRHPDLDDEELKWRVASINYDEAFVTRARAYSKSR